MIKMDQSSDTLTDVKKDKQKVDFHPAQYRNDLKGIIGRPR